MKPWWYMWLEINVKFQVLYDHSCFWCEHWWARVTSHLHHHITMETLICEDVCFFCALSVVGTAIIPQVLQKTPQQWPCTSTCSTGDLWLWKMFCYVNSVLVPQIKRNKWLENKQLQNLGGITCSEFFLIWLWKYFFTILFFFFFFVD